MTRAEIRKRVLLCVALVLAAIVYWQSGLHEVLTLDRLQASREMLVRWHVAHPVWSVAVYMVAYVLLTALSFPGATVLTLGGAAVLGFWVALVAVSVASTVGATLAFLVSRYLLRDWVTNRFSTFMPRIDGGVRRDGTLYLFTLRLVPAVPFVVVNLVMGLTSMRTWTYFWVSQLGMLPGTAVYVYAGQELGQIRSTADIFSGPVLVAFVLLSIFPFVARFVIKHVTAGRSSAGQRGA